MNTNAVISFVLSKFVEAAGGEVGSDVASALLNLVMGNSNDMSSEILSQVDALQTQVGNLASQTADTTSFYGAHSAILSRLNEVYTIIDYTKALTQDYPTDLDYYGAITYNQWDSIVDFLTPGGSNGDGTDYNTLSNNLISAAYGISLTEVLGSSSVSYGSSSQCYAYAINTPLLNQDSLFLGDYIGAHVKLLTSVLADIALLTMAGKNALQAMQKLYANRGKTTSAGTVIFTSLPTETIQSGIEGILNRPDIIADMTVVAPSLMAPFYNNIYNKIQNAPAVLCSNAYTLFQQIASNFVGTITNTSVDQCIAVSENTQPGSQQEIFIVQLQDPAMPDGDTSWKVAFSDTTGNNVTLTSTTWGQLFMQDTSLEEYNSVSCTPSSSDTGAATNLDWAIQLWGNGPATDITFYYLIRNGGYAMCAVPVGEPATLLNVHTPPAEAWGSAYLFSFAPQSAS